MWVFLNWSVLFWTRDDLTYQISGRIYDFWDSCLLSLGSSFLKSRILIFYHHPNPLFERVSTEFHDSPFLHGKDPSYSTRYGPDLDTRKTTTYRVGSSDVTEFPSPYSRNLHSYVKDCHSNSNKTIQDLPIHRVSNWIDFYSYNL